MFRERTNLFLLYRRTVPRQTTAQSRFNSLPAEEEGLMGARKPRSNDIELKTLAPLVFDIAAELDGHLLDVRTRTNELTQLYKKLLLARDQEKKAVEGKIDQVNFATTKIIEQCYVLIKKYEFIEKNHHKFSYLANELAIVENYKKTYALKLQETSLAYRNLQNNYMQFLRDDDETDLLLEEESQTQTQTQVQSRQLTLLAQREREILKLATGILEISTIFREMESLVVDQGLMLDRIDYNLLRTYEDLKTLDRELTRAQGHQKRTTKCKVILLLTLVVFALLIAVLVRPHTKVVVKQPPRPEIKPGPPDGPSDSHN